MKKLLFSLLSAVALVPMASCGGKAEASTTTAVEEPTDSIPTVYYIKDITSENLVKVYEALGRKAEGNNVGVKISTGESMKSHHLDTGLIKDFVHLVNGKFIECNTAYNGNRSQAEQHYKTAQEHGYTAIAPVDIMDADGDTTIVVNGGTHLAYDIVGKHFLDYDFLVVLSHFKGHAMGGFGGALKNISIGIASADGKSWIHTAGKTRNPAELWQNLPEQDAFIESMAEAAKAVVDHVGEKVIYINVANNLSVDCDCDGNPAPPKMADLGILASLDPVALDKACVDMVFNFPDSTKTDLIERINSRHGTHILDYAEKIGVGSQKYNLVTIE